MEIIGNILLVIFIIIIVLIIIVVGVFFLLLYIVDKSNSPEGLQPELEEIINYKLPKSFVVIDNGANCFGENVAFVLFKCERDEDWDFIYKHCKSLKTTELKFNEFYRVSFSNEEKIIHNPLRIKFSLLSDFRIDSYRVESCTDNDGNRRADTYYYEIYFCSNEKKLYFNSGRYTSSLDDYNEFLKLETMGFNT